MGHETVFTTVVALDKDLRGRLSLAHTFLAVSLVIDDGIDADGISASIPEERR
jgi:hypothetical protein